MAFLDTKTIIFSFFLTSTIIIIVMLPLWLQNRRSFNGISYWMVNFILQALGQLLFLFRGTIPDFASVVVGNMSIMAGMAFLYGGLERFIGKKGVQVHNYILVAVFGLTHAYFGVINPNLAMRTINVSLFTVIIFFQSAWLMLWRVDEKLKRLARWTGAVCISYFMFASIRILSNILDPSAIDFFKLNAIDSVILLAYQLLGILLT